MDIVVATRNRDKAKEIGSIMAPIDVTLLSLDEFEGAPDVVEDGRTLEENALKKAREIRDYTGRCALADDTGLEVEALGGAPGVYAARYAGADATYDDNCRKLLREMTGVPPDRRGARFRCVIAIALTDEVSRELRRRIEDGHVELDQSVGDENQSLVLISEGMIEGRITTEKRGDAGFGYDPVFEVRPAGKTLAEMAVEEKNRISHRYRALVEAREMLLRYGLAAEVR